MNSPNLDVKELDILHTSTDLPNLEERPKIIVENEKPM